MTGKADTSWNSSINSNKSWAELMEEEEQEARISAGSNSSFVSFTGLFRSRHSSTGSGDNASLNEEKKPENDDKKATSTGRRKKKQKKEDDVDVWTVRSKKFEIIDEESSSKTGDEHSKDKDALFDIAVAPIGRFPENAVTDAPLEQSASVKSTGVDKPAVNTTARRTTQRANNKNAAIDSLLLESKSNGTADSLTGHLDIFHVDSPIKPLANVPADVMEIMCETTMFSPIKRNCTESATVKKRSNDSPGLPSKRNCAAEIKDSGTTSSRAKKSGGEEKASVSEPFSEFRRPRDVTLNKSKNTKLSDENAPFAGTRSRKRTHSDCSSIAGSTRSSRYNSSESLRTNQSDPDRYETDAEVLIRRQKQIDYGKNTAEYQNYRKVVPLGKRTKADPKTPPKHLKYSRRSFDGLIKSWRCRLHEYDDNSNQKDHESTTTDVHDKV